MIRQAEPSGDHSARPRTRIPEPTHSVSFRLPRGPTSASPTLTRCRRPTLPWSSRASTWEGAGPISTSEKLPLRVRSPSRIQRRHGARPRSVQQGQPRGSDRAHVSGDRSVDHLADQPCCDSPMPTMEVLAESTSGWTGGSATCSMALSAYSYPDSKSAGSDPLSNQDADAVALQEIERHHRTSPAGDYPNQLQPSPHFGGCYFAHFSSRLARWNFRCFGAGEPGSLYGVPIHQRDALCRLLG